MSLVTGAQFVLRGTSGEECVGRCGTTCLLNLSDPRRINTRRELKGKTFEGLIATCALQCSA